MCAALSMGVYHARMERNLRVHYAHMEVTACHVCTKEGEWSAWPLFGEMPKGIERVHALGAVGFGGLNVAHSARVEWR